MLNFIEKWGMLLRDEPMLRNGEWLVKLSCKTPAYQATTSVEIPLPNKPDLLHALNYLLDLCRRLEESSRQSKIADRHLRLKNLHRRQQMVNLLGFDGYREFIQLAA